jgi:hypothetical protein
MGEGAGSIANKIAQIRVNSRAFIWARKFDFADGGIVPYPRATAAGAMTLPAAADADGQDRPDAWTA